MTLPAQHRRQPHPSMSAIIVSATSMCATSVSAPSVSAIIVCALSMSSPSCQPGSCQQTDGGVSGKSVANNRQNQEIQSLTD